jgi:hypothetical protein
MFMKVSYYMGCDREIASNRRGHYFLRSLLNTHIIWESCQVSSALEIMRETRKELRSRMNVPDLFLAGLRIRIRESCTKWSFNAPPEPSP